MHLVLTVNKNSLNGWMDEFIPLVKQMRRTSLNSKTEQTSFLKYLLIQIKVALETELSGKLLQTHILLLMANPSRKMNIEVLLA